ncbi:MAG: DUF488 domain-containing protein [Armatimonadota bacterium]|nr:DUF488 domain-containing protein [Armatimonadota bacterium]MDR7428291.1 DUF488 domain-containing protein [Armatimonadota bacterium]MDR7469381.1 DUF488 domain-containing protein [Armatimonadota bacterium]MDR7474783.1 DUF488 domain-containing protein [Armatimonadota bacterium]MDR7538479.1 DUF488 domain-containing protein [Armatimonadota bacterium]
MPTAYTLGTSTRSPQEFLDCCRAFGIVRIVDVRRFPTSRRFPHFVQPAFAAWLQAAGIAYVHLGESLGGFRVGGYEAYMASEHFRQGLARLEALLREAPAAVVCSERLPWRCHRRFIARELEARGWAVIHIIDPRRTWVPAGQRAHSGAASGRAAPEDGVQDP